VICRIGRLVVPTSHCQGFDRVGDDLRDRVVDHVAHVWNGDQPACRNLLMEAARLPVEINNPIVMACDDRDRHPQ
jgi:hypothetical protein